MIARQTASEQMSLCSLCNDRAMLAISVASCLHLLNHIVFSHMDDACAAQALAKSVASVLVAP